jgi:hypothetical protein
VAGNKAIDIVSNGFDDAALWCKPHHATPRAR